MFVLDAECIDEGRHQKPKKRSKTEKKNGEQWDSEAALNGYVLPEVPRLFYSCNARRLLNKTSCASLKKRFCHRLICAEC
jgi:hypothetical protein